MPGPLAYWHNVLQRMLALVDELGHDAAQVGADPVLTQAYAACMLELLKLIAAIEDRIEALEEPHA